jgi:hypothetical protein
MLVTVEVAPRREALTFPDFEDGERLRWLADTVAGALGGRVANAIGNPTEVLFVISVDRGDLSLYWDGYSIDLRVIDPAFRAEILERLIASGAFELRDG